MKIQQTITDKLNQALSPQHLEVVNESHMHNVPKDSESHFKITIVSNEFNDKMLIARHRMINKILQDELNGEVHALALHTMTAEEWADKDKVPDSPLCHGGDGIST